MQERIELNDRERRALPFLNGKTQISTTDFTNSHGLVLIKREICGKESSYTLVSRLERESRKKLMP